MTKTTAQTWCGVFGTSADQKAQSDYDRACLVDGYVGLIYSNEEPVIVLGQEPLFTTWYSNSSSEGTIVRCVWANDLKSTETEFYAFESLTGWENTDVVVDFPNGHLVLFDSSAYGSNMEEWIEVKLDPGRYFIKTLFFEADESTKFLLHRFSSS
ncbi:MAG: hypothetical protein IPM28_01305 [Chloracidobacterium sp.]|nr:hypothetical protein [Chloracidobacterium sp.]